MINPDEPNAPELLETLLEPLLDDFNYWFERSRTFLETEPLAFLDPPVQADLLQRVRQAQTAVQTTRTLMHATDRQVGVDTAVLMGWHRLVAECWQVAQRYRREQAPAD